MIRRNDRAVSPVVGVMLMLVVTIIIAAVVSAFAGGMSAGNVKPPQVSISGVAVGNNTVYTHNGGDPIDLNNIKVMLQSQDTKTTLSILDSTKQYQAFHKLGDTTSTRINPGESFIIAGTKGWDGTGISYGSFSMTVNSQVPWSIIDAASGNTIASGVMQL